MTNGAAKGLTGIFSLLGIFMGFINTMDAMSYSYGSFGGIFLILGVLGIIGNVISLMAVFYIDANPKGARIIIIVSSLIAGLNLFTLIGGIIIKQDYGYQQPRSRTRTQSYQYDDPRLSKSTNEQFDDIAENW
ncbi:MAG: hypothetical protein GY870_16115 [archaeon]|nr:hypothetical protein [archaeon]